MKSNKLKREPKYIAKFKAFPYQQEAVDAVKDLEYAAIFHEQGLGKTKIAIDVLLYWLSECSMDTALIVTKKQLVANWVNEFKDHTSIKPAVLNTDKNNNYRIFCGPYRVVLTNFETLETEKQQFELYLKVRNVGIIIDESAKLKNPNSKLTKTYFELAPLFQRRIIMTGTPVANRPYDIWAQIYFLDFGESLGADFNEFKKETDLIVETILSSKPGYKVIAGILENLGEKVCTDLLKKIDLFSGHDNDKLTMLIKANKSKRLVDFDFSLLQFIPYFHVSNLLSKQEEQIIMNSAYELKEAPIRKILLLHLDELKDVLIKTNGAQPGDTQIISVIEEQIKELYHQISIFEL